MINGLKMYGVRALLMGLVKSVGHCSDDKKWHQASRPSTRERTSAFCYKGVLHHPVHCIRILDQKEVKNVPQKNRIAQGRVLKVSFREYSEKEWSYMDGMEWTISLKRWPHDEILLGICRETSQSRPVSASPCALFLPRRLSINRKDRTAQYP